MTSSALAAVVAVLVATNVWVHLGPSRTHLVTGPIAAAALLGAGRLAGLSWAELGFGAGTLTAGLVTGLGLGAVVATALLVASRVPRLRSAFRDSRYQLPLRVAVRTALVTIPLATVAVEESGFRGVLWGLLARDLGPTAATWSSAGLFGVGHVLPALDLARTNTAAARGSRGGSPNLALLGTIAVTVLVTAAAGVVLGELRRWTGSLLAPALVHWAANGCAVLASALLWRREGGRSLARDEVVPQAEPEPEGRPSTRERP